MWILDKARKMKFYYKEIIAPKDEKSVGGTGEKIPINVKLKYNMLGFSDKEIIYYDLQHNDYRNYISQYERLKLENVNGRFAYILGEKVLLERMWGAYIHVPHTYLIIQDGRFWNLSGGTEEVDVLALLKKHGRILAKPTRSIGGGHGVCTLQYLDGYYIDKRNFSEEEFIRELRTYEGYILTQWIYSHEYASNVFPETTNTMRIVTVMNHLENKAEVMMAIQRFGTKASVPVDNSCSGGIRAIIDIETGVMGTGHDMIDPSVDYDIHPDTGKSINGLKVPNWGKIKQELVYAHNCSPYYEFLAWDAALADDGNIYILEINRGMDVHWIQVREPLRKDKLGKYMREKGMLRKW